jgi:hypothetical protein
MTDHETETDTELREAYRRLDTTLAPPADVAERVQRRIGVRRTRRRATLGGVGVLAVAGIAGAAALLGGGDSGGRVVATDAPVSAPAPSFVLTRADGSSVTIDDLTVSCDQPVGDSPAQPGHIYLSSPFDLDASGKALTQPFFYVDAVVADVDGKEFTLPLDSVSGSSEDRGLVVFAADAGGDGDKHRANEVSSAEQGASGTVRVLRASCDPVPVLELEVDGTLGSEVGQGAWGVKGSDR